MDIHLLRLIMVKVEVLHTGDLDQFLLVLLLLVVDMGVEIKVQEELMVLLVDLVEVEEILIMETLIVDEDEQHLNRVKQTFQEQLTMDLLEEMVLVVQ